MERPLLPHELIERLLFGSKRPEAHSLPVGQEMPVTPVVDTEGRRAQLLEGFRRKLHKEGFSPGLVEKAVNYAEGLAKHTAEFVSPQDIDKQRLTIVDALPSAIERAYRWACGIRSTVREATNSDSPS